MRNAALLRSLVLAALMLAAFTEGLNRAYAQAPSVLIRSAPVIGRAVRIARDFIFQYTAGKGLDQLLSQGKSVQAELASLEARLKSEELARSTDRANIMRQRALVIEVKEVLSRLMEGSAPSAEETSEIEERLDRAIQDLRFVQEDHGRRIGKLEEGLDSLRYVLEGLAGVRTVTGGAVGIFTPPFQMLGNLRVTAAGVQSSSPGNVRVILRLDNENSERRVAVAWKAENSDGIADYWKFFPRAKAFLEDDDGSRYRLNSVSGLGFGRTREDWAVMHPGESAAAVLEFSGRGSSSGVRTYSMSVEFWIAGQSAVPRTATPAVLFLNNIR